MTERPEELNKARFLEHLERCVNGRDYDAMYEYYAPTYTTAGCAGQGPASGPDAEVAQLKAMVTAFPDFCYDVDSIIAEGDNLAVTARFRGHHRGVFMGLEATGRWVDVPFVDLLRFEAGLIVDYWGVFDTGALRSQLEPNDP